MGEKVQGTLVIVGGAEKKEGECVILRTFLELAGGADARIIVLTTATLEPQETGRLYTEIFARLGTRNVTACHVNDRLVAQDPAQVKALADSTGIFFTGGDQLRITTILGGTPLEEALFARYRSGAVVAGTSAGASAMSDLMIVEGESDDTPTPRTLRMAPGVGLLEEVVIDQHFAQRGRIGRLLMAVSQNPYVLGVGLDEDTAIVVSPEARFRVVGSQAATVLDGRSLVHSNVSELGPRQSLAVVGATIHLLPGGYGFDLKNRTVIVPGDEGGTHLSRQRRS